jgi:alkylation response protein AidB-like acyl-CoA dehydrogenase
MGAVALHDELCDPVTFRGAFADWLSANEARLTPFRERRPGPVEDAAAHDNQLRRLLGEAGWTLWGWPEEAGGKGGNALLRAVLYDELVGAGYIIPEAFNVLETIGPMLCTYAPHLARDELTAFAAGRRMWSQGFSEPDSGSDMASIRTRAVLDGDVFRVDGQKIWVSYGHMSDACGVLVRTGDVESRHRGLSILWIDMTLPGVTCRPIPAASGRNDFSEMFFDDVVVPRSCLVGELNAGWKVAMHLLQFERGMYGWIRQAWLHRRLEDGLRARSDANLATPAAVGEAYLAALSLRLRCRSTVQRLADDAFLGPEISVDKLLLSTAEQGVFDTARLLLGPDLAVDDDPAAADWRSEWFYSRATSIYGGTAEVQRDIVAEHLLGLPKGR